MSPIEARLDLQDGQLLVGVDADDVSVVVAAPADVDISLATGGARPEPPTLHFHFDGSRDRLRRLLAKRLRDDIDTDEIDVSFRFLSSTEQTRASSASATASRGGTFSNPTRPVTEFTSLCNPCASTLTEPVAIHSIG